MEQEIEKFKSEAIKINHRIKGVSLKHKILF